MPKKDEILLVAVDDGYAQTKLYGDKPNNNEINSEKKSTSGNVKYNKFIMRSAARPGRFGLVSLNGEGDIGTYNTIEEEWTVSEQIESESTQYDGFHTSSMNRVLVNHALVSAGYGGKKIKLITGLPVEDFFFNGKKNLEKIEAKKKNLLKSVSTNMNGIIMPEICEVEIGCQALSAFVDYYLDDNLKEKDVPIEKVAIVDIGGRTTDIALIIDGQKFDPSRSGTSNVGVLDVYNTLSDLIKTEFKIRDKYPLSFLNEALRNKKIKIWGKQEDISKLVDEAINEQKNKIAREIERKLGGASDLDKVIFVGGGSVLFGLDTMFPNGYQPEDSEFSNARGLYKYSKYFG